VLIVLLAAAFCHRSRAQQSSEAQQNEQPPNVVIIMTDDQGYGDFSRHGNPILETPIMDRLAEGSIRFTDFHVASACTPTRGQLLTGLDALRNGASVPHGQRHLLKRGIPTMADIFRENGYRTAMYGKWHLGGNSYDFMPHERGFDDAVWFLRGGVQSSPNYWNSDLMDDYLFHNGHLTQYGGYATDVWFDLAETFVGRMNEADEPFFLYLPLNAPHGPHLVPDLYREPYTDQGLDKTTETFFGMIASVDDRLGSFLDLLGEENVRDNTLLIFLTDNGTANGADVFNAGMRGRKASPYEGGHRVPLFIRWPAGNLRPPGDIDALVHVQDLLPTLIDLLDLRPPPGAGFDGTSLVPLLQGRDQPALRDRILAAQRRAEKGAGTVMWRKWRLVGDELYDVSEDPDQQNDVSGDHPDIIRRLTAHYDRWWEGIQPHLDLEPYRIPANKEVKLTAYDWWYGQRVWNWPHLRRGDTSNGRHEVVVDEPGTYEVALRRWPRESGYGIREGVPRYVPFDDYMAYDEDLAPFPPGEGFDIRRARVQFGGQEQSVSVTNGDKEATIIVELPAGKMDLQTWFTTADGKSSGAHYVYIRRL